jgi:predicted RNase H-like HicB family nuclease
MQIPVLVEPIANNGFSARIGEPLPLSAEGATPEEALRNLRTALDCQLSSGKQLQAMDLTPANPWLALAGIHDPNDPLVQEWKQEMAIYRQELENDPDRP